MVDRAETLALIAASIYDDANRDVDKELDRCMEIARGLLDRASSLSAEKAEEPAPPASAQGETPTWRQIVQVVRDAEKAWAALQFGGEDTSLEEARDAAVRSLCLSRAPSIDDVVDALLRVQPFRDGHETGATGLIRRADVEQVMRALFDRRNK